MSYSRAFFYFCLCFLGGVLIASFSNPLSISIGIFVLFFALVTGIAIFIVFYKKDIAIIGLCIFTLIFGIYWEEKFENEIMPFLEDIHFYNEKGNITFEGIILEKPEERMKNTRIIVESQEIIDDNDSKASVRGKVLITLPVGVNFDYGDKIEVTGKLQTPQKFTDDFDWPEYLRKERIYSTMYEPEIKKISSGNGNPVLAKIFSLKEKLEKTAEVLLPPEGALLSSMTLNDGTRTTDNLKNELSRTGLSHITAISGMNIVILFEVFIALFLVFGFWRWQATIFTILFLIFYIFLIGAPPSAVRAVIMGGLMYSGLALGRLNQSSRSIVFAATGMVIANPLILARDVGFQLSFLASVGLIYLLPILKEKWQVKDSMIKELLCMTLAAQAFCLPILIYNFGQVPILSPLSNILVVPLLSWLLGASLLFLLLGTAFPPLALPLSFIIWLPYTFIIRILDLISAVPFSTINFKVSLVVVFLCYILLFYFTARENKKSKLVD